MQGVIEVRPETVATLSHSGRELPYVEYGSMQPPMKLVLDGEEYWYYRTLPLKGYGAIIDGAIAELDAGSHRALFARFDTRIYIFATGVTPIGAGKPPGAG
jgi:hypothetical protein